MVVLDLRRLHSCIGDGARRTLEAYAISTLLSFIEEGISPAYHMAMVPSVQPL
jgi:hypothetical protein